MGKKLNEYELLDNYKKIVALAKKYFESERASKVIKMYEDFEEIMIFAPASSFEHFHNAHVGGYCEHVLNVINSSIMLLDTWKKAGFEPDFTEEELVFSAMFHDFGKLGDGKNSLYVPETSKWHIENMGRLWNFNEKLNSMDVTDRALYTLNQYGISYTEKEWYGIKLADGLYNEMNKQYLIVYNKNKNIHTSMHILIHHADHFAMNLERLKYFQNDQAFKTINYINVDSSKSDDDDSKDSDIDSMFDEILKK